MPTSIDELQIEINAKAVKANQAIDSLVIKLDRLTSSLNKIDGSKFIGLANGVQRLGSAMQTMNNIKTADFTRLSTNLQKLGTINTSALNATASSLSHLTRSFNQLGTVSANAQQVGILASNLSKLGNASVQRAITNIPQLATAMNNLMTTLSRAPRVSANVIQMTQALANLANQGSKVGSASKSMQNGLNRASTSATRAKKSFGGLASAIGRFYATYFMVIRGLKGLWNSIESTTDYIEAFNYFDVALGKIGSDWAHQYEKYGYESADAYADSFAPRLQERLKKMSGLRIEIDAEGKGLLSDSGLKNLGLNIQEVTQYASQLASVTNSIGQTGEVSLATASALTKLGADMSSLFNVDYSQVMNNLQSGIIGQSRALYRYGLDITNATLQTKAYELGLSKAVSEMTQAEKMQLRLLVILRDSKVAWGDLANTINSPSNMIRQFKNNLKEAGMVLGQLFTPLLQKVMPILNGVTIAIKRLLLNIAQFFGIKLNFNEFSQGFSNTEDNIDDMSDSLDDMSKSAKKAKAGLRGFDELKTISSSSGGASDKNATGGIDLTDEILKATSEYEKIWEEAYKKMESRAEKFADRIEKSLKPIKKLFKDISIGDWFAVGEDVTTIVVGINDFLARAISSVNWKLVGENIGKFLNGIDWKKIAESFGRLFWTAINAGIDLWKGMFSVAPVETGILSALAGISIASGALSGLSTLFANLSTFISPIITSIESLGGAISSIAGIIGGLSTSVLAIVGIFAVFVAGMTAVIATNDNLRASLKDAVSTVSDALKPAFQFVADKVLPDLKKGWNSLLDALEPVGEYLEGVFTDIWEQMIIPILEKLGTEVLPVVVDVAKDLWNNVLVPFGSFLMSVLKPAIKVIVDVLTVLWKNVTLPLAQAISGVFLTAFKSVVTLYKENVIPKVQFLIEVFEFLWNNILSPFASWLTVRFGPIFKSVFEGIKKSVNGISTILQGVITFITGAFTADWKLAWNGLVSAFKGIWDTIEGIAKTPINAIIGYINGMINGIEKAINNISKVVNELSFDVPDWVPGIGGQKFSFDMATVDLPNVEYLATGGFPSKSSLFVAGENGIPEMLGTVGGKTAVAGGVEITGIRDAIYSTSMQEMQMMREQNTLLRGILEKEFGISSDAMFKSVRTSASDYTRRTGRPAFS